MFTDSFSDRVKDLRAESAFEMLAKARRLESQGRDIIHLEIGEPDFRTPDHIVQAGMEAMRSGHTRYTQVSGMPQLKESISTYVHRFKNVDVGPEGIVVVPGGKPIIFYTLLALVNEGDEVLCPNPGFPIYENVIRYAGGIPVSMELKEENDFRVDLDDLRRKLSPKTKLMILNSPANPTGGVLTGEDIRSIADMIAGKGIFVLSDEIYDRICYDAKPVSMATIPEMKDHTIILDGFSKTYSMTGWRLGYGVMEPRLADRVSKLIVNSVSCTAAFVQMAGKTALDGPQDSVDEMVAEYRARRDMLVEGLNSIPGISCIMPQGAFYAFPNIKAIGMDSNRFAEHLLEHAGVAVLSGTAFGSCGEGYVRLSYANSMENLKRTVERIAKAVQTI